MVRVRRLLGKATKPKTSAYDVNTADNFFRIIMEVGIDVGF